MANIVPTSTPDSSSLSAPYNPSPSANPFNTELNTDIHKNVLDSSTMAVSDVLGGGMVATVVDTATSMWNSLPGTDRIETADVLKRISTNALQVYNEHTDAIETASFIGGMFVPMGVATKGMKLMRAGVKGANWFNQLDRVADLKKIGEAVEATASYRDLTYGLYAKTAINQAIDAVAGEVAMVIVMNAHPFMEDYMKDIGKNFTISALAGGALGMGIGHIADRFAISALKGNVEAGAINAVVGTLKDAKWTVDMSDARKLQTLDTSIGSLDEMMAVRKLAGKDETNDLTFAMAKNTQLVFKAQQVDIFESMISNDIKKLSPVEKDHFMRLIVDNEEMLGAEKVKFLTEAEVTMKPKDILKVPSDLADQPQFIKITGSKGPIEPVPAAAVYFQEIGLYGVKEDSVHYANAAIFGQTKEQMTAQLPKNYMKIPNYDSAMELLGTSSAHIQKETFAAWNMVKDMSIEDLKKIHIGEGDLPKLNAVLWRLSTDAEAAGVKIKVSNNLPITKQIIKEQVERLVSEGKISAQDAALAGPDAAYYAKMDSIGDLANSNKFGLSFMQNKTIESWVHGPGKNELSHMALDHYYSQVGSYAKTISDPGKLAIFKKNVAEFDQLYNSSGSLALRAKFQEIADKDGYVYLYRGYKTNELRGQGFLESMTTHWQKANQFTGNISYGKNANRGIKLHKVHVSDIVAGFQDVGGGPHNAEIIVRATSRPIVAELSSTGKQVIQQKAGQLSADAVVGTQGTTIKTTTSITKQTVEEGVSYHDVNSLSDLFIAAKQDAIDTLLANGMPAHAISVKTNTDLAVVEAYMMGKQGVDAGLDQLIPPNMNPLAALNKIKTFDAIDESLKATNQPLVLEANHAKNPLYQQRSIGLDMKAQKNISHEFMTLTLLNSKSSAANELAVLLDNKNGYGQAVDQILAQIGLINNSKGGNPFFSSMDMVTRNMEGVGAAVNAIGKGVTDIAQRLTKKVIEPIEAAMIEVKKDPAALVEFVTFQNVNAGLSGWRTVTKEGHLAQKVMEIDAATGKKVEVLKPVKYKPNASAAEQEYKVVTPSVRNLIDTMQENGGHLRELGNTINRLKGSPDISDIGLWIPSFNPVDKFIAYVHDVNTDTTKLLWARTAEEFQQTVSTFKQQLKESGTQGINVYTKNEQAMYNKLKGRLDPINMERADIGMLKTGSSASAIVKPDLGVFGEIAQGYEFHIASKVRELADINLHEITDNLKMMGDWTQRNVSDQPLGFIKSVISKPKNIPAVIRNTLLGSSNLGEYEGWQAASKTFETAVGMGADVMRKTYDGIVRPFLKTDKDGQVTIVGKKLEYEAFNKELADRGIQYPWSGLDEQLAKKAGFFNVEQSTDTFKRLIYGGNALAATMALRFGEIAQPLVNAMSFPVLTGLAIADYMPATFLGVQKATAKVSGVQVMYEGARAMHSEHFAALNKRWETMGVFKPMVSEVTDTMRATRSFDTGVAATIEKGIDSHFVKMMSKPADYGETLTRKMAMNTGAVLAKRLYPELDDVGVTIFARDFMDKALGNFHSAQRPVMFQGTLGVALGLFQTYMLTLGQNIYKHVEHQNWKALGVAGVTQSSLFGVGSLPGFENISHAIGDHFSDDNVDLTTGTYRGTGNKLADFIMYGLPSNTPFGASFSTRGGISPRVPSDISQIVSVNAASQIISSIQKMSESISYQHQDMGRAFLQALSLQSMSRPFARASELATGYSITGHGNTVQVPEEVWTFQGVAARLMSTRPLEEQKLRDADHLNHVYGALDRDRREEAMNKLKTAIRGDNLTDSVLANTAENYLRHGGSPQGWRSAIQTVIGTTDFSGKERFLEKLKPNNPLMHMIDNTER